MAINAWNSLKMDLTGTIHVSFRINWGWYFTVLKSDETKASFLWCCQTMDSNGKDIHNDTIIFQIAWK